MSLQDAIATPVVIALADGADYTFTKIGIGDWCKFCQWANQQKGQRVTLPIPVDEMLETASTVPGMRWLAWQALQEHHKGIHIDALNGLIGSFELLSSVLEQIMDLPEPEGSDPPAEAPETS